MDCWRGGSHHYFQANLSLRIDSREETAHNLYYFDMGTNGQQS